MTKPKPKQKISAFIPYYTHKPIKGGAKGSRSDGLGQGVVITTNPILEKSAQPPSTSGAIATGDKQLLNKERKATPKHSPIAPKSLHKGVIDCEYSSCGWMQRGKCECPNHRYEERIAQLEKELKHQKRQVVGWKAGVKIKNKELKTAREQGKLEFMEMARKHTTESNIRSFTYLSAEELVDWLKSQLKTKSVLTDAEKEAEYDAYKQAEREENQRHSEDRVYISHTADEMREIIRTAPKGATIELHEGYKKGCWECYLRERIAQLEAEVMGLEGCCQVLEKAFGVPKKATLKQIDERIGYFVKLEGNLKVFEDVCRQYKKELKTAREQGKLAGKKEFIKHLCRIWWKEFNQNWDYTECCDWLKSQLSKNADEEANIEAYKQAENDEARRGSEEK